MIKETDEIERLTREVVACRAALDEIGYSGALPEGVYERLTRERDEARAACESWMQDLNRERKAVEHYWKLADDRAVQVVALREWLEREAQHSVGCPSATGCTGFGDPKYLAWKMLPDNEKCTCDWGRALTDTAATARETERRLRIEGALEMQNKLAQIVRHHPHSTAELQRVTVADMAAAVVDAATAAGK